MTDSIFHYAKYLYKHGISRIFGEQPRPHVLDLEPYTLSAKLNPKP